MKYMLDTNICIYVIKRNPEKVLAHLRKTRISDVYISSITLSELEYGVQKSTRKEQNRIALAEFAAPLEIAPYDDLAAREYGEIRAHLEKTGKSLGALDALIAAHARALKVTLVTNNEREFKRVPGLPIKNWTK